MSTKNITTKFVLLTFSMAIAIAGLMLALAQFDITLKNQVWVWALFVLYDLTPAVASYVLLKRSGQVKDLKNWLQDAFRVRDSLFHYGIVFLGVAVFFALRSISSGLVSLQPFYIFLALLPVMLVVGGMEETGWRYILQEAFNKKYGFAVSAVITGLVWYIWHLPLFWIPGTQQYETFHMLMYALFVLGFAFLLGAIYTISDNVFLCILCHAMINAGLEVVISPHTWTGTLVVTAVMMGLSLVLVAAVGKRRQQ